MFTRKKGGSVKVSCTAGGAAVACTSTKALPKGTYYVAVRTGNAKGWSSWSKRVRLRVR